MNKEFYTKRIYAAKSKDDGLRVLVDRLWPRGLSKENAKIDLWLKEAAPTDELRKWFAHDPAKWNEFRQKYFNELNDNKEAWKKLIDTDEKIITLLYGAKDEAHNQAIALKEYLDKYLRTKK